MSASVAHQHHHPAGLALKQHSYSSSHHSQLHQQAVRNDQYFRHSSKSSSPAHRSGSIGSSSAGTLSSSRSSSTSSLASLAPPTSTFRPSPAAIRRQSQDLATLSILQSVPPPRQARTSSYAYGDKPASSSLNSKRRSVAGINPQRGSQTAAQRSPITQPTALGVPLPTSPNPHQSVRFQSEPPLAQPSPFKAPVTTITTSTTKSTARSTASRSSSSASSSSSLRHSTTADSPLLNSSAPARPPLSAQSLSRFSNLNTQPGTPHKSAHFANFSQSDNQPDATSRQDSYQSTGSALQASRFPHGLPRSDTASSTSSMASASMYSSHQQVNMTNRRTPSNATSSTASSVHRSASSRSNTPLSYVALLRKQKATVWCDRSQSEDPRIAAAQRLAKERAEREVALLPGQKHHGNAGGAGNRRTPPNSTPGSFTSGVARKIRHHGAQKATTYAGGNMAGAGVPMRLSATEVDDDDDEGAGERLGSMSNKNGNFDEDWDASFWGRTSSRPSAATAAAASASTLHVRNASGASFRSAGGHAPGGAPQIDSGESTPTVEHYGGNAGGYFGGAGVGGGISRSSTDEVDSPEDDEPKHKTEDELRRRGSVDDRAMTMSGVRLFVANPDSDSD